MSYMGEYIEACDWIRKELSLPDSTSIYELVVKTVNQLKLAEEKIVELEKTQGEDQCQKKVNEKPQKKQTKKTASKSKKKSPKKKSLIQKDS